MGLSHRIIIRKLVCIIAPVQRHMNLVGVILDWAGTIVDHGSRAPVDALQAIFSAAGVDIELAEARAPMGIAKKAHIEAILRNPRVRAAWRERHGADPTAFDTDELYAEFIPRQTEGLERYADLIAGVAEAAERMRSRGLAIGSTTGYTRPMLDYLLDRAALQGFRPDAALCPDDILLSEKDTVQGRPAPWMCYQNAFLLNAYPMRAMVKIGDTPVDMEEGLNAGMWTIGITRTGNEVGLTADEWQSTPEPQQRALLSIAQNRLLAAGAHYLAGSVGECDDILDVIGDRVRHGQGPSTGA